MKTKRNFWTVLIIFVLIVVGIFAFRSNTASYVSGELGISNSESGEDVPESRIQNPESVSHISTPEPMKALYMTACAASTPSFREHLVDLLNTTEFNSIIIDIKDFSGTISIPTELIGKDGSGCRVPDMKEFIEELHGMGVYVIGRVTVFQDPFYSKRHPELAVKRASDGGIWADYKGLNFIQVGARPYWDYIVELAYESWDMGFDEINFDYVRFPSDGNMKDIAFPLSQSQSKPEALEEFFVYLYDKMKERDIVTSADLFGMTTTNKDDLNIGQVLEKALPYFDYIAPMVYPSHYPTGFNGYGNPNSVPYEIVNYSMQTAVDRVIEMKNASTTPPEIAQRLSPLQLRPWLQDFDYGGDYGVAEIHAQIDATYDAGLTSWYIWDPANRYTKGAYLRE